MRSPWRAPARASIALAVIVTCQLMLVLDATVANIALVPIQRTLRFSDASLAWVIDAYTIAFGGLLLLGGRAGDVFGRRRMLTVGLAVFTLASLLGGLAPDGAWLLATRAVQGVGAAFASPSTLSLISATFEEGPARNRALGIFTAVSAGGGSLGLVLGGALTSWFSWRWVFFINVPIGLAIVAAAPRYVSEPPRNGGRLDLVGASLATSGLVGVIYAFVRLAERASAAVTATSLVLGVLLIVAFVAVERRQRAPLMPIRLLVDRVRGPAYLTFLFVPAVMFGVFFFTSQYLEGALGYSAVRAGLAFLPLTGMIFSTSRVTPRLVARVGARPVLLFGLVALAIGALWIARATPGEGYFASLFGPFVLFGLGAGCCFLPLSVTILAGVPRADSGAASGMLQTLQQTGAAIGVAALTSVASAVGRADALLAGAGIVLVALVVAFVGVRPGRPARQPSLLEEAEEIVELATIE